MKAPITSKVYLLLQSGSIEKEDIKFWLLHRSGLTLEQISDFYEQLSEYHSNVKEVVSSLIDHKSFQDVFDAPYFYKTLGVDKSTFSSWKSKGYFSSSKVTLEEIENFLNYPRHQKYRKLWEKR